MAKKLLSLSLILFTCSFSGFTQTFFDKNIEPNGLSFYLNSPTSYITNIRFRLEKSISPVHTLSLSHTSFYGFVPGYQTTLEFRKYKFQLVPMVNYVYAKSGYGESFGGGNYGIAGFGLGNQLNFSWSKHFFFQYSTGLKLCLPFKEEIDTAPNGFKGLFYLTGPGSLVDFNLHFGLKIF